MLWFAATWLGRTNLRCAVEPRPAIGLAVIDCRLEKLDRRHRVLIDWILNGRGQCRRNQSVDGSNVIGGECGRGAAPIDVVWWWNRFSMVAATTTWMSTAIPPVSSIQVPSRVVLSRVLQLSLSDTILKITIKNHKDLHGNPSTGRKTIVANFLLFSYLTKQHKRGKLIEAIKSLIKKGKNNQGNSNYKLPWAFNA